MSGFSFNSTLDVNEYETRLVVRRVNPAGTPRAYQAIVVGNLTNSIVQLCDHRHATTVTAFACARSLRNGTGPAPHPTDMPPTQDRADRILQRIRDVIEEEMKHG